LAGTVASRISYQGRLTDAAGNPLNGNYNLVFQLWNDATAGSQVGSDIVRNNVPVESGLFTVELDVPQEAFNGQALWLRVQVNGQWLSPRQELLPVPYALSLKPGATVYNTTGLGVQGRSDNDDGVVGWTGASDKSGVFGNSQVGTGVTGRSTTNHGVQGFSTDSYGGYFRGWSGIWAQSTGGPAGVFDNAVRITGSDWHGIQIDGTSWAGIWVDSSGADGFEVGSAGRHGLHVHSANEHGVYIEGTGTGDAIHIDGAGNNGLRVDSATNEGINVVSAGRSGVYVYSAGWEGVEVGSAGYNGVYVQSAGYDGIRVQTAGQDGLRIFDTVGRDYIRAGSDVDLDFRVTNNGTAYADGGWQGAADFAELMSTEGNPAAYEPGDVLVISAESDRSVALSSKPYSTMVIGIYSEEPGFVGSSHAMEEQRDDEIPVAIVGIVPCKVSAENGPIHRGDLLTTSSTLGHAMKASEPKLGAILGKALGELESGTGVIDVLVTLQ